MEETTLIQSKGSKIHDLIGYVRVTCSKCGAIIEVDYTLKKCPKCQATIVTKPRRKKRGNTDPVPGKAEETGNP